MFYGYNYLRWKTTAVTKQTNDSYFTREKEKDKYRTHRDIYQYRVNSKTAENLGQRAITVTTSKFT